MTSGDRTPQGIASVIARRIHTGELRPGDRLPTVRDVASDLGVSPGTVSEAWKSLRHAGLVIARGRAGSFVADAPRTWLPPRTAGLVGEGSEQPLDLSRGTPDPDLLPDLGHALERVNSRPSTSVYQDDPVLPELRDLLTGTWPVPVEQFTVVDGALDGVARTLEQVVRLGDRVAVESPGYPPILDLVDALGAEPVPMLVDERGVVPDSLARALTTRPAAMVIQPRAHNPTGASLDPDRAAALAEVATASQHAPVIVEDDHSWSISTARDVTLATHLPDQVVHIRGFSKSYGPELRIAAIGGPARVLDRIVARRMLGAGWTSRIIQSLLLDLLTDDRSIAEVRHARSAYAQRQRALVDALRSRGVDLAVPDGINLWLPVARERAALVHLATAGIRAATGAPFIAPGDEQTGAHLRVTAGRLDPEDAEYVADVLASTAMTATT